MPQWAVNQIQRAFRDKDIVAIIHWNLRVFVYKNIV
jgi:hypothetical protein